MTTLPLEEAPFHIYLQILKENGHEENALISEQFYVDLLTTMQNPDGEYYTREDLMKVKFKDILAAATLIIENAQKEMNEIPMTDTPISGKVMAGKGAESLSPQTLRQLAERQALYHEENKTKQMYQVVR